MLFKCDGCSKIFFCTPLAHEDYDFCLQCFQGRVAIVLRLNDHESQLKNIRFHMRQLFPVALNPPGLLEVCCTVRSSIYCTGRFPMPTEQLEEIFGILCARLDIWETREYDCDGADVLPKIFDSCAYLILEATCQILKNELERREKQGEPTTPNPAA